MQQIRHVDVRWAALVVKDRKDQLPFLNANGGGGIYEEVVRSVLPHFKALCAVYGKETTCDS